MQNKIDRDVEVDIDRKVFNPAYIPFLDCIARHQIVFGGSASGKSVFLSERSIYDLLRGGRNYLIVRKVARTIRGSVFTEICKVIAKWNVGSLFSINKTDMVITCINGYQILFAGLDDVEKLKSITVQKGALTDIWVEEATEIERTDYKQLIKRQRGGDSQTRKRITLSFNPILKTHWIYQDFFSGVGWADNQTEYFSDDLAILKTWYIHNRFLTADDIKDLTDESDSYFYQVYTLGNWGVLGNVIFTNWRVEDLSEMIDQFTNRKNGLDFGFASDPAAALKTHYDRSHKRIYIYDELYERGLTNDLLADKLKPIFESDYIICDSAEPKSIQELNDYGINAIAAEKGKDSVLHGIQTLQQHEIIVDKKCINTVNELSMYKWKETKDGDVMAVPADKYNHAIDALRYAYEDVSDRGLFAFAV